LFLKWTRFCTLSVCLITLATSLGAQPKSGKDNPSNLIGHGGPIKAIAIDGARALTGSFDYSAILWSLDTRTSDRMVRRYADHGGAVNAVAFVPTEEKFVSAGDDGSIYLWSTLSDKLVFQFEGHQAKVVSLAVSQNGRLSASASWDKTVRLWDLENLKPGAILIGHKAPVNAVLISADGKFIYSASVDGEIIKWLASTGEMIRVVHKHGWGINEMAWMPGGKSIVFGAANGDAQVLDPETGTITKILIPHQAPVLAISLSKNMKLLATGDGDGVIRVWRLADWSVAEELFSSFGPIWSMDFGRDNTEIYYAGLDDYAVLWKISPRETGTEFQGKFPRRFQKLQNMPLGERQFATKCSICHTLGNDDKNRAGPSLYGVFGRVAGTLKGYKYSAGLIKSSIVWNEKTIGQLFDLGPQYVTPGSKMPLQKITNDEEREALISFLKANTR